MKSQLLFLITIITSLSYAQNQELSIDYRIGLASNRLLSNTPTQYTQYDYQKMRSMYDQGLVLGYQYKIWKRFNLFLSGGLELSQSSYYLPLVDYHQTLHHLDNIEVKQQRYTLRYGIHKQFTFYEGKVVLDLGCEVVDKYYFNSYHKYSSDFKTNSLDGTRYSYTVKTYYGGIYNNDEHIHSKGYFYLNADYMAKLKLRLHRNVFLDLGVTYSRNNIFFYNYSYSLVYYQNGSPNPTGTYNQQELDGDYHPKYIIRDHFLYFNAGVTYKFDKLLSLKRRKN